MFRLGGYLVFSDLWFSLAIGQIYQFISMCIERERKQRERERDNRKNNYCQYVPLIKKIGGIIIETFKNTILICKMSMCTKRNFPSIFFCSFTFSCQCKVEGYDLM